MNRPESNRSLVINAALFLLVILVVVVVFPLIEQGPAK